VITAEQLQAIMPRAPADVVAAHLDPLNAAAAEFGIDSPARLACWLGECSLECNQLRGLEEDWGPSEAQARYEPPSHVATELGNTQTGDGYLFRGRGPIQITGRSNYQQASQALGVDLVNQPDLAATPGVCWRVAGWFWSTRGLNELADGFDIEGITRRINGGLTDLALRTAAISRARAALGC